MTIAANHTYCVCTKRCRQKMKVEYSKYSLKTQGKGNLNHTSFTPSTKDMPMPFFGYHLKA